MQLPWKDAALRALRDRVGDTLDRGGFALQEWFGASIPAIQLAQARSVHIARHDCRDGDSERQQCLAVGVADPDGSTFAGTVQ